MYELKPPASDSRIEIDSTVLSMDGGLTEDVSGLTSRGSVEATAGPPWMHFQQINEIYE